MDKQIREAQERGEFDNLPSAGKPLEDLDLPYDQVWTKRQLRNGELSASALLPTPLRLRKEIEELPTTLRRLPTEQRVREAVEELNNRIRDWLLAPIGPSVHIAEVDVEHVLRQWCSDRVRPEETPATQRKSPPLRRWWRNMKRRPPT